MIILTRGCSLFLVSNVPPPSIVLWEWVPGMLGMLQIPAMALHTTLPSKMAFHVLATAHSEGRLKLKGHFIQLRLDSGRHVGEIISFKDRAGSKTCLNIVGVPRLVTNFCVAFVNKRMNSLSFQLFINISSPFAQINNESTEAILIGATVIF